MRFWVALVFCILLTATGNCLLRSAARSAAAASGDLAGANLGLRVLRSPALWSGLFCYVFGSALWIWVLTGQDLVLTYPVFVGGTFVLVMFIAWKVFSENLSWPRLLGATLVLAGIMIAVLLGQNPHRGAP